MGNSNDELAGRLAALEVIAMMSVGMYLANARNDPDYTRAGALIDHMRKAISDNAQALSPAAAVEARQYGNQLLDAVAQNLRALRGEGGQLN